MEGLIEGFQYVPFYKFVQTNLKTRCGFFYVTYRSFVEDQGRGRFNRKMAEERHIVIIDGQPICTEGIKKILRIRNPFLSVWQAGTSGEGLQLVTKYKPDLVVMEIWLQDQNTLRLIRDLKSISPESNILVFSMYREFSMITEAFQAGATGYLFKDADVAAFLRGVETVLRGIHYLDGSISPDLTTSIDNSTSPRRRNANPAGRYLTIREEEVLRHLAEGMPRKEIANILFISPKTVENHISKIMKKLSVRNTTELIRWAARFGVIDLNEWKAGSLYDRYPEIACGYL
jgi:DNA-binding NarL/FixJ family response regulator